MRRIILLAVLLAGCSPAVPAVVATATAQPTATKAATVEVRRVTATPKPTDIPTLTLEPTATSTRKPTRTARPTATPSIVPTLDLAAYAEIDVRELDTYREKYEGQRFVLRGEVFNIEIDDTFIFIQMFVRYPGGNDFNRVAVVVIYKKELPGVYKETNITVYGEVHGTFTGTNTLGGSIAQPRIWADLIEVR